MFFDLSLPLKPNSASLDSGTERETELFRSGHFGTHLDRVLKTDVPLEYFKSRAIKIDISSFSNVRPVTLQDIPESLVQAGDFVLFHTEAIVRNPYASRGYMEEYIEFSWELIDFLLGRRIHFIGLDARGVRQNQDHREADIRCEKAGAYVIENLTGTGQLPVNTPFVIYVSCFNLGGTGIPCKVIAELPSM